MEKLPTLPLLNFFHTLRNEMKLELGIKEYELLLELMRAGYGLEGKTELLQLCKMLWMKSQHQEEEFDEHFETVFKRLKLLTGGKSKPDTKPDDTPKSGKITHSPEDKPIDSPPKEEKPPTSTQLPEPQETQKSLYVSLEEADSSLPHPSLAPVGAEAIKSNPFRFIFTDEYLPFSEREISQIWRSINRPVPHIRKADLHIQQTVDSIAKEGMLIKPIYKSYTLNTVRLLLLIDREGSMMPFHQMGNLLVRSAVEQGNFDQVDTYYFNNCPGLTLYTSKDFVQGESLKKVLKEASDFHTVAIIFSDAGAARGAWMPDRIKASTTLLNYIRPYIKQTIWINPLARFRWKYSSAEEISAEVPMFEGSRSGLEQAAKVLNGQSQLYSP